MPDRYVVNHNSQVIHDRMRLGEVCGVTPDKHVTCDEEHMNKLLNERGYRRCSRCNRERNDD
jgi:hypothetical protein